jgi:hypothetical protein
MVHWTIRYINDIQPNSYVDFLVTRVILASPDEVDDGPSLIKLWVPGSIDNRQHITEKGRSAKRVRPNPIMMVIFHYKALNIVFFDS